MQDNENEYEQTNEYGETPKPSGSGLRAQLEAVLTEKKTLEDNLLKANSELRERSIADTLSSLGVSAKVAKFIPSDVNDKDSIAQWVTDNADVFNIQLGGNQTVTPTQSSVDPSIVAGANRLNLLSSSAQSPSKIQDIEARIASASSKEELESLWAEARAYLL